MSQLNVGDRVVPKDPTALWRDSSCSLVVLRSYPCDVPTMRDRECIQLEVRWLGRTSFVVGQFADTYERYGAEQN